MIKQIGKREFYATLFNAIINGYIAIDEKTEGNKYKYFLIKNKGFSSQISCEKILSDAIFCDNNRSVDLISFDMVKMQNPILSTIAVNELKNLNYFENPFYYSKYFINWCNKNNIDFEQLMIKYKNYKSLSRKENQQNNDNIKEAYTKYSKTKNKHQTQILKSGFSINEKRYTKLGAEERAKWLGFKDYLQTAERFRMDVEQVEIFSKYLPYAIALGVETKWAKRFEDMNVNRFEWFRSQDSGTIKRHENQKVYFNHLVKFLGQIYVK